MNGTILIDLDGTLLVNPMNRFVEAYLARIQTAFSSYDGGNLLTKVLMQGTQRMTLNQSPAKTLRQVFDEYFYPTLNIEKEQMQADLDRFYAVEFSKLQSITAPRPGARELVERLVANGYQIAVATNPLFPLPAIEQRLAWAGLPVEAVPYKVVASYETFHFAKPNTAFYAEILARMGWPEGPVLMIGDDMELDIEPANQLGLPTYWTPVEISDGSTLPAAPASKTVPTGWGTPREAWDWLKGAAPADIMPNYKTKDAFLAVLKSTPAAIQYFIEKLPDEKIAVRARRGEWAPVEILCHLRDVDIEVNLPRIRRILKERNPHLTGVDSDVWAEERRYLQQEFESALVTFQKARMEYLGYLEELTDEDWQRPGRHTILGRTDLTELTRIAAEHDRLHIRQFWKACQETAHHL
jgi:FMN phosphatase YigB (HAD superfamily)